MLKKRIIPCLDIKDGRTVKGTNFLNLRDAGNPVELAQKYVCDGADELVFLDITATIEKRKTLVKLVENIASKINIPFTVGGGINCLEDAEAVIKSGADKVSINSSAVRNPKLISEIAKRFGNQAVVLAIDTKFENGEWLVFVNGGSVSTEKRTKDWAKQAVDLGAGEILLTSMNHDGTRTGFAIELCNLVCAEVNVPIIASGGAGNLLHFKDVFENTNVSAALAAGIFHYGDIGISELKNYLKTEKINVR
ncbi:MAG: imidazole glycerol phosphate synthase subunit HisF [Bacteroidales bacterium]|nr:imidazole glycerol phosphate synthase subunit HisF [Bacteroidales bacterium]